MIKLELKLISGILILMFLALSSFSFGQNQFSKQEVLEDLNSLKQVLIEAHFDVYAYTSEEKFNLRYEEVISNMVNDSLSYLEASNHLQRFISVVNNGHTAIDFPVQSYISYAQNAGTVFPLEIAFENDKALVRKNWSKEEKIQPGMEIISINGKGIPEVLAKIHPQISAERTYFKNAILEMYSFPRYYWQVFGQQDSFLIQLNNGKQTESFHIAAINCISDYEMLRDEVINAAMKLEFLGNVAYLNPGGFSGDLEVYESFIDSSFQQINQAGSTNLIIDLRNNPGGDDAFSNYLVSYIANKDFQWNSSYSLKTSEVLKQYIRENYDSTETFWRVAMEHKSGEKYDYEFEDYPAKKPEQRFNGDVYVLINRQSHSQAALTAAQIQDYQFAKIVGEETGDYGSLYASIFTYTLPNTGILVNIPKGYVLRVNGSKKLEGVIPDIFIKDYLLDDEDEIMQNLLELLNN